MTDIVIPLVALILAPYAAVVALDAFREIANAF